MHRCASFRVMTSGSGEIERTALRWHAAVGHTADVGVRATAPDIEGLLEEAAVALAELSAEVGSVSSARTEPIEVRGDDLTALTYAWLSELVGLADALGEALVRAEVHRVEATLHGYFARGVATFAAYGARVRPRMQVKAATFHRLKVTREPDGWALEAYFDV